ncbi:hypothetical protein Clacol_004866 [Clathrus columnatus]|uniref:Uncharacterized protein n=1 Tax=Clathrus columnatus TaxID=1419009 RepID=A0AAV5ABP7_9AGAM|nr:hypothetical protein Clacol_004866 [Clathrus columnatus]
MGVEGLWKLLPAAEDRVSLFKFTSEQAFNASFRPYILGIDASLWTYHAQAVSGTGENAEIELIFHRCCRLLSMPVAPLFVFDGPDQPKKRRSEKRSKAKSTRERTNECYYLNGIRGIVSSFGFELLTAPGEAEATLAQLNSAGIINAILSDDVDCFLFGTKTVLRSITVNNSPYCEYVRVYSADILKQHGFSQEELVFIALLSGGDYDPTFQGLSDCGITTASQLRFLEFGKALKIFETTDCELEETLCEWRVQLRKELETNKSAVLSQKNCKAANNLTDDFPRPETIRAYFHPSVLNDVELEHLSQSLWKNELKLERISGACEMYFMWSSKAGIIKTFE